MSPQFIHAHAPSPRGRATFLTILGCAAVLTCGAVTIATQSRIIRPQPNSNNSGKRARVATLRASDSPEGSRVALSSDQSLSDYEAYRRGDRFYVKIPASDVPRPEIVRGRAFADVKVQRSADSTVVSFRLQPGATARVEQHSNKLDVVFTMPGGHTSSATASNREVARNNAGPMPPSDSKRRTPDNSNSSSSANSQRGTTASKNANDRAKIANAKASPTPAPTPKPTAVPSPSPVKTTATPQPSPSLKSSPLIAQQKNSPSPLAASTNQSGSGQSSGTTWNNLKERARYWILLAQLNPLPVAIGAAVLLLLIGLFIFQRRRAKTTRRTRPRRSESTKSKAAVTAAVSKSTTSEVSNDSSGVSDAAVVAGAAVAATAVAGAAAGDSTPAPEKTDGDRHERVARVSEEVKKVLAGGDYDQSIIASEDRETRQLVGAELLSALVGRNLQRRERARAVFMNHGYFDDATRDLRIAESDNERAAAARRLSFVHDREATPHLVGALDDPSPDVRRAAVEALMDLRDPAAISPLNSLMQTEIDRKVPRTLIKHAIEACATSVADDGAGTSAAGSAPTLTSPPTETEREVIEI